MEFMVVDSVHTLHAPASPYEYEVARRWWALSPGSQLPLQDGGHYQLIFHGRSGGSLGPDIQDAVLRTSTISASQLRTYSTSRKSSSNLVGDVEFHVRASDWFVHRHHTDPRYNKVILHVVLICDASRPTTSQDGRIVPLCSLNDLVIDIAGSSLLSLLQPEADWACHTVMQRLSVQEQDKLLLQLGLLRFEQKTDSFVEQLHRSANEVDNVQLYDVCLFPALAEGLGYGRDREFFRAAGLRLLGLGGPLPEPAGHMPLPSPLDSRRLRALTVLLARWRTAGIWQTINDLLLAHDPLQQLRTMICSCGLSSARADILICNIVLPFAVAVALLEHDTSLAQCAQQLYIQHPGLSSNRITRMMCAQLQLLKEPSGSCLQQGLQYVYQQTCREKQCDRCLIGKKDI